MKAYISTNNLSPVPRKEEPKMAAIPEPVKDVPVQEKPVSRPAGGSQHPEYEPDFEDIELSNMRKVIAKRLLLSKVLN